MSKQTVKCPICEEPYNVYMYYAGNQSACPDCRQKAQAKEPQAVKTWCTCWTTGAASVCPIHKIWTRQ